jgi:hypothetical protein
MRIFQGFPLPYNYTRTETLVFYSDKQEKFCGPTHVDSAGSLNVEKGGALNIA